MKITIRSALNIIINYLSISYHLTKVELYKKKIIESSPKISRFDIFSMYTDVTIKQINQHTTECLIVDHV